MARISHLGISHTARAGLLAALLLAAGAYAQAPAPSAPAPAPAVQPAAAAPAASVAATATPAAPKGAAPANKPAVAPIAMEKPLWKDLTASQQRALEPLVGEWDKLEGLRKQKWLEIANRYNAMKPDEQARVQERMRDWVRLTPDQRRMVRENFARSQKVAPAPGQKSAQWEQYQQLPEEQKKQLADKAPKKQVVNPPSPAQSKIQTVPPVKRAVPGTAPATAATGTAVPPATAPATAGATATSGATGTSGTPGASAPAAPAAAAAAASTQPAANVK